MFLFRTTISFGGQMPQVFTIPMSIIIGTVPSIGLCLPNSKRKPLRGHASTRTSAAKESCCGAESGCAEADQNLLIDGEVWWTAFRSSQGSTSQGLWSIPEYSVFYLKLGFIMIYRLGVYTIIVAGRSSLLRLRGPVQDVMNQLPTVMDRPDSWLSKSFHHGDTLFGSIWY